jgi:hypothetical protein
MAHRAPAPVDPRLEDLLETERRIEARIRAVEESARARVEAAREAAEGEGEARAGRIEAAARAEEDAERLRDAEALRRIEERAAKAVARLSGLSDADVERLARAVYERVVRGAS